MKAKARRIGKRYARPDDPPEWIERAWVNYANDLKMCDCWHDYTEDAAPADYSAYQSSLSAHKGEEIRYRAIHFYGPEEVLAPLTKNLSKLA